MKMESRKQRVVPFFNFVIRLGRYFLFALALILFTVALGTVGYHQLEWLDSFY